MSNPGNLSKELNSRIKIELIHQSEDNSAELIGKKYNIPMDLLEEWGDEYRQLGEKGFLRKEGNRVRFMSRKTKVEILKEADKFGLKNTSTKFGISKECMRNWKNRIINVGEDRFINKTWKGSETYKIEKKMEIVKEAESMGVAAIALKYDIAKCTIEDWMNRLGSFGAEGLQHVGSKYGNYKDLQGKFGPKEKVGIVKEYCKYGLKATCRKFGCSQYYLYGWKHKIERMGVAGFLKQSEEDLQRINIRRDVNNLHKEEATILDKEATGEINSDSLDVGVTNPEAIKAEGDHSLIHSPDRSDPVETNEYGLSTSLPPLLAPYIASLGNVPNPPQTLHDHLPQPQFTPNYVNNISPAVQQTELAHKILFLDDMRRLLPLSLFTQFKEEFRALVDKYQIRALRLYNHQFSN